MALEKLKYNFFGDNFFTVFENVKPSVKKIDLPLGTIDTPEVDYFINGDIPILRRHVVKQQEKDADVTPDDTTTSTNQEAVSTEAETQEEPQQLLYHTNNSKVTSKREWVNQLANAYRRLGISENGIRNLITKNALESNWGKSAQGKFNYGNITASNSWKGKYVIGRDKDVNGKAIKSRFRSYDSIDEYAIDELRLLKRLYDFDENDDIETFADKLKGKNKGGYHYAVAKNYKQALLDWYKLI